MSAGMLALKLIGRLPLTQRRCLGRLLGDLIKTIGIRKKIVMRNLQLAFPNMSDEQRQIILRRHYQSLGMVFFDECAMLTMPLEKIRQWLPVDEQQLCVSRATIVCAPHFVAASIGGVRFRTVNQDRSCLFYYKPMHSHFWDNFYTVLRSQYGSESVSTSQPQSLNVCARQLKHKDSVLVFLPDIDNKMRKSTIFAPFLGMPNTATTTAVSRLAAATNAQVRLLITAITPDGYQVTLSPPLDNFPSDDNVADTCRINALIGKHAQELPEQYYWLHRRFKTRPPEEKDRYA